MNKPAPESLGGPFNLILASNAVHTCDNMAGAAALLPHHAAEEYKAEPSWHIAAEVCSCMQSGYRLQAWRSSAHMTSSCCSKGLLRGWAWNDIITCACAETLANIHGALAEGGFLMIYETTAAFTCCLWGLDERTWNFTDEREYGLWIAKPRWHALLAAAGFTQVVDHWCAPLSPPTGHVLPSAWASQVRSRRQLPDVASRISTVLWRQQPLQRRDVRFLCTFLPNNSHATSAVTFWFAFVANQAIV